MPQDFIPSNTAFNKQFLDLLRKIFVYDPKQRISAKQALKHPWFKESLVDDGTEAIRIREQRAAEQRMTNGVNGIAGSSSGSTSSGGRGTGGEPEPKRIRA